LGLMLKPVLRNIPYIHQLARKYNPQSVRIKPSEVFGDWKIATEAKLELIVWLDRRKGITKPEVHAADATLSSRIIGSTINAYDPWCLRLTEVAMGLGLISPGQYQSAWEQIIAKGVKGARQVFLFLPDSIPMGEISSVAAETLKLWELLGS
ncbi:MAG TPA: hypothetical protein VHS59_06660, partial [Bacillota bacterium]|nr:hypothetical protein [Bacillota bacterium]